MKIKDMQKGVKRINSLKGAAKKIIKKDIIFAAIALAGAAAVTAFLAKDEDKGVQTQNYRFDCTKIIVNHNYQTKKLSDDDCQVISDILHDYDWLAGELEANSDVMVSNGFEKLEYSSESGRFVNPEKNLYIVLNDEHKEAVNKIVTAE